MGGSEISNRTKAVHSQECAIEAVANGLRAARRPKTRSSDERESQQARAQHHEAGRYQREERTGD
jgi:hypothetical protein